MALRRRSPRPLIAAIEPVRRQLAPASLLAEVQAAWPQVVGAAVAENAQPIAERGGTLTVVCSAAVWAQELDLMQASVIADLNQHLDSGRVNRLRCTARA